MKKFAILSVCFLLLAVFAYSAAADIVVTNNFNEDTPTFGGDNQKASNPDLDEDDSDWEIYDDGSVSLQNNGTSTVNVDGIAVSYRMLTAADFNITLKQNATITAGSTGSITLSSRISEKIDAVNAKQEAVGFHVADIQLKSGTTVVATFHAYMQRENQLVIDDVKVIVGDDSQTVNDDNDDVEDIKPGDKVDIIIKAENKFRDSDEVDIDADNGRWEIGGDVDEEDDLDFGDLGPKDEDELEFSFTVDEDVDEGNYDFVIFVDGEDQYGARHGERIKTDFSVERQRHEISIQSISVVPNEASCNDLVTVKVEVANLGKKNEDDVTIRIQNEDLDIDDISDAFELDKGDTTKKTFDFVIPVDAETGSKAFTVYANYDFNEETDRDAFNVDVESCTAADTSDDSSDDDQDDGTPAVPPAVTGGTTAAQPTDDSVSTGPSAPGPITTVGGSSGDGFRGSTVYVLLLILAIIIVVMVGAFLIAKMLIIR